MKLSEKYTRYCTYISIIIGILICFTLIGNGIACMFKNNPNLTECNYIVYGGITLFVAGTAVGLIIYLIKERIKMNKRRRLSIRNTEPRIVVFEDNEDSTGNPLHRDRPVSPKSRRNSRNNIILSEV